MISDWLTLDNLEGRKMDIKIARPPNFEEIVKVFPTAAKPGVVFAYDHTIFNPTGNPLPIEIIAHECTHSAQQDAGGAVAWWDRYLHDPSFRLTQEIEAHRLEWRRFGIDHPSRHFKRAYLKIVAKKLSGPLYNNMISYADARAIIKGD